MTKVNEAAMDPSIQRKVQAIGKEVQATKDSAAENQKASADQLKQKIDQLNQRKQKMVDAEKMRAQNQSGAIGQETGTVQPIADKAVAAKAFKPMTVQDKEAIAHQKDDRVAAAVKSARKKIDTQPKMTTPHTKGHDNMREAFDFPEPRISMEKPKVQQPPSSVKAEEERELHVFHVTVSKGGENKHTRKASVKTVHGKDHALAMALNHYKDEGWDIHDHKSVKESTEHDQLDELSNATLQSYKDKAMKSADELTAQGQHGKANDRLMNHMKASGKQITKTMSNIRKSLRKEETELDEARYNHNDNRTGFGRRAREDDEYHVPDPVGRTHKIIHTVSKEGGEKHSRTVTITNSTKSHEEAKVVARAHLEKQGYKIHEEVELDEAHKIGDKVVITKGPKDVVGKSGHIGEIRNGAFKGAIKTYTIDHDGGSVQLKSTHFKKHIAEEVELDETKISKYKDLGATKQTTHFVKNVTTGEVLSPHRGRADAEEGLRAAEADGAKGHKFKIVRAIKEGTYEDAEENKKSADSAKKQGDMFAHHLHMADHHDNMAQWHASKGRHGEADRHAEKSEQHHEKAMTFKEEVAANSVAAGGVAGFKGDAGKKAVMTKPVLKRKTLEQLKTEIK